MMTITKKDRILGTFYGQALGDAMGMPSELWPRQRVKTHFGWIEDFLDGPQVNTAACYFKAGQFTDDTAMALAIADAIIECKGEIKPEAIAKHILCWAESFDAFNKNVFGPSSKAALLAIKNNEDIHCLENNGVTNGAAMRISPLGCLLPTSHLDKFIDDIALACSPTHKSDVAIAGATVIAWAIAKALQGHPWQSIKFELPSIAKKAQNKKITTFSPSMAARIELALSLIDTQESVETNLHKTYDVIGAGVGIIESVPAAIAMVDLADTDPNQCAVLCANLGGDTDTIGAMATAICGALHGIQAINPTLKEQLDKANQLDFQYYAEQFLQLSKIKEQEYAK